MATRLDIRAREIVARLLSKYGVTATMIPQPTQTYSPLSGEMIISEAAAPFEVVMTPPVNLEIKETLSPMGVLPQPLKLEGKDNIRRAEFYALVKAEDITQVPAIDMKLRFQEQTYQIVAVGPIYSGELVAVYGIFLST